MLLIGSVISAQAPVREKLCPICCTVEVARGFLVLEAPYPLQPAAFHIALFGRNPRAYALKQANLGGCGRDQLTLERVYVVLLHLALLFGGVLACTGRVFTELQVQLKSFFQRGVGGCAGFARLRQRLKT